MRDESEKLIGHLFSYQEAYHASTEERKKEQFYACRQAYNSHLGDETIDQAARFIFLNKTCYNGLFRVNNGGFNDDDQRALGVLCAVLPPKALNLY